MRWMQCERHFQGFYLSFLCQRNFVCLFACSLESLLCCRYTIERSKIMEPGYALKLCKLQNFLMDKNVGQLHKYIFIMIDIFRKSLMHQYISQYLCLKFYQQDIQLAQDSIPSFKNFQSKCKCSRQYIILSPQKEILQQTAGRKSIWVIS